jgi:hypothetical protein
MDPPTNRRGKDEPKNTNNVNKTWILLQTGGGKDEPNKHKKRK